MPLLPRSNAGRLGFGATVLLAALASVFLLGAHEGGPSRVELLNVSYDPTRELYRDLNAAFAADWKRKTGQTIVIRQSHGGSGSQSRSVINGLEADVVTLGLPYDVDAIEKSGLIAPGWRARLPDESAPFTSTVVFLVRKGNPKGIHDWDDLLQRDVSIITASPKTSSAGRWCYVAAWGYAETRAGGSDEKAREFVGKLYRRVPVLDSGARAATTTFAQRGLGDVLLTWENEAFLAVQELGRDKFEIVNPPVSVLAELPVALVDGVVDKKGTRAISEAYLEFLYTPEAQEIAATHGYRPRLETAATAFPRIERFTVLQVMGGWEKAQKTHFADGGVFDGFYR